MQVLNFKISTSQGVRNPGPAPPPADLDDLYSKNKNIKNQGAGLLTDPITERRNAK